VHSRNRQLRLQPQLAIVLFCAAGIALTARFLLAQTADGPVTLEPSFEQYVKPFFVQNCIACHNSDMGTAGIRVDQLDAKLEDRHIQTWGAIRNRIRAGTMPPKGLPQPSSADRQRVVEWIGNALEVARLRPGPKNGLVRRLTVSQYRNTLRDLLLLDDDLTGGLPPDAISKDGFVNNKDTLQLSPLLTESYFEIAEAALDRSIVDTNHKPSIQNFRVDLGAGINRAPLPEKLVLGADSMLLENPDFLVTQLTATKPFTFEPFFMRTKYRYIEGYRGNDTVRGWRDYDSIYHAVFADMRGSKGYPKGDPYNVVPQGLLLRPAIPNDEIFGADGTYGPKANFKISLRELPDDGRFRVTVMAAKYNDGLLLDPGIPPQTANGIVWKDTQTPGSITIPQTGVYQVDVYGPEQKPAPPDSSRLGSGLAGTWPADMVSAGRLEGKAKLVDSPVGKAVSLSGSGDAFIVPREALPTNDAVNVGEGDFSVAAWIHPSQIRTSGIVSLGAPDRSLGWYLETFGNRGILRFATAGRDEQANAIVSSSNGVIRANTWQHVAAVVRRGKNETRLYVNGNLVGRATSGTAQFDDTKADLQLGGVPAFTGELADVRLYNRPLDEAEIQALVQPGRQLVQANREAKQAVTLTLGGRQFSGLLPQPAFLAVRLDAGPLQLNVQNTGAKAVDRVVFTPLPAGNEVAQRFLAFEKRVPRLGVHLGLRRDCGSTLAPVGDPQIVAGEKLARYIFEGAIRNFPSPSVEKDNVNYLAGVREIGVHSEYTDGRDMPRLLVRSVEFEGPFYESWPPPSHRSIFVDFDRKSDLPAYSRKIVNSFATRAYRRPVTASEEAALLAVYQKSIANGRDFEDSIKDTLLVVLTSPQFLLLVENSKTPAPEPLDSYELSSKLSYFLWNGPPDQKTLQLAASGTLRSQLDAEVRRMIADRRFAQFASEFTSQWLSLDKFQVLDPDRKRYPKLTRDVRAQLKQEPVEFLQYLIRNNLPVRDLIQSDFVVANEAVASYYDLSEKPDSGFQFVPIRHGRPELGGLLTQAAILAGLSDGRESNPVKRGAWLARKIIAEPPADPPPNVPVLKEDTSGLTLRQRIEQHRNQPGCQQCHAKIDPWGVAFEQFDAGGRMKAQPVDAKSTLPDNTEINGANDLKRYLGEDRIDQVAFSFLKHLTTYATGRTLTYSELAWLKQDGLKLKATGYRMQDMVRYVVNSKMFLEK
jgi:mono/diheme cytochrome c family protein